MSFISLVFHISHFLPEIGSFRQKTITKSNAKSGDYDLAKKDQIVINLERAVRFELTTFTLAR